MKFIQISNIRGISNKTLRDKDVIVAATLSRRHIDTDVRRSTYA